MLVADVSNDGDDSVDMEEWVRLVNNIYRGMNDWQVRISFLSHNFVFLFLLLFLSMLGISWLWIGLDWIGLVWFGLVWFGLVGLSFNATCSGLCRFLELRA
jgi:hypothetical protein